jgi:peptidoglycan hydrolase-like protein with peptidoglycan-binding domain
MPRVRRSAVLLPPMLVIAALLAPAAHASPRATAGPAAASGRVILAIEGAMPIGSHRVTLAGQRWRVSGKLARFVPGQVLVVTFRRSGHQLATVTTPVRPARGGRATFSVPFRLNRPGRVRVAVAHLATPALGALRGNAVVDVVAPSAGYGAGGLRVAYLQRGLRAVGYAVHFSGRFDDATARAVLAFRKVNGMARNGSVNHRIYFQLAGHRGAFRAKYPGAGRHAEADLSKQVLALINPHGRIYRVYHISSGKPSTPTVLGSFSVISKTFGYNSLGMLDADYFADGGYAVHGYHEVPTFAASHGCIRAPIPDASFLYHWLSYGTRVDVYQRGRRPGSVKPHRNAGP